MSPFISDENRSSSSVTDFDNTSIVSESPADTQASKKADLAGPTSATMRNCRRSCRRTTTLF